MNINKFNSGYIPAPIDERNYKLSYICKTENIELPKTFRLVPKDKVQIQSQGSINGCVSEALSYMAFEAEYVRTGNTKLFSPGWIYGNRGVNDNHEMGMIPSQPLKHLLDEGNVYLEDFGYFLEMPDIESKVLEVKDSLLGKAKLHRITAYAELHTIEEMKMALVQLRTPLLVGLPICQSFFSSEKNGYLTNPDFNKERIVGYHGVASDGWDDIPCNNNVHFDIPNSWGVEYGDKGWNHIPQDFPFAEVYAITYEEIEKPIPKVETYYRVQTGAYKIPENADIRANELLTKYGIASCKMFINGLYKVQCGSFINKDNAVKMRDRLIGYGYKDAFITKFEK